MNHLDRKPWLRDRQGGLGGTDLASIAGVGYEDALNVYESKVADEPPDELGHPLLQMGLATEPYNAALYAAKTGAVLFEPGMVRAPSLAEFAC